MEYKNNMLEQIGNTPLIKLNRINKGLKPQIFAKLESANPGGSVKDRIGFSMIEDAERKGVLKSSGTIIEATSGNTGIGLAISAAVKGYRCIFVVTSKVSAEKINYLKAFGAEVIVVSNLVDPDDPEYYVNVARRLSTEIPNSFFAYQYSNPSNPEIHYKTTGPEIWRQTDGKITHFVSSIGTGGTISGTGRFLKEKNPNIQVIGADPLGSIFKHYKETGEVIKGTPYLVEGIGQDCLPENVHFQYIDKIINVSDKESFAAARRLTKEEGIFCGGSTGTIVNVALDISKKLSKDDVVVFIVCDTGERYLSKVHNEDWLKLNRMLDTEIKTLRDISDRKKSFGIEEIISVKEDDKVKDVLELITKTGYSQIPVLKGKQSIGAIRESRLLSKLVDNPQLYNNLIKDVMEESLPILDAITEIEEVKKCIKNNSAILVSDFGLITDIITRYDLINLDSK
ncbi:MAG: pyridoxal-phosphate dependent enzyme [Ignavibacteriota bacterium]|nr:pyridoxal-phosphate dependent enzyme [Ignavibacteriales bacterium]MBL1122771.1 pyridoxal-phosphate dependent enzyme [Ignavibacteriota bacterium]MCC7094240.1 pyridoxal-phosphate dependent enzyme [Ignavibacteriaceae bacterium]QKJ95011.1 MAG: pyridoxal-phosphate dependent enzyme [Ignavibacteriota bacterium]